MGLAWMYGCTNELVPKYLNGPRWIPQIAKQHIRCGGFTDATELTAMPLAGIDASALSAVRI